MIVVVGGTGRLGRLVAGLLVERGERVRVVARNPPAIPAPGTEFVRADVRDPATLHAAVTGSAVVVSAMHGMDPNAGESPETVDRDGNIALFEATRAAGGSLVLVSTVVAAADSPIELFRMKAAAESALRAGAPAGEPDWTIVRAGAFVELWLELFRATAGRSGVPKVMGRGRTPMTFVSVGDVAVAVARAATDPSLRGQVIQVGGEDLSPTDLAAFVTAPGKRPAHLPRALVWTMGNALRPVKPSLARLARQTLALERFPAVAPPGAEDLPWLPHTPVTELIGH
jgi:uncharacterized protein YbjT (DUF2867 family)